MIEELKQIGCESLEAISELESLESLEQFRVSVLGKKGKLSTLLKGMGKLSAEERPKVGQVANEWKNKIEAALGAHKEKLEVAALEQKILNEKIDVTLPSLKSYTGTLHPLTQATRQIVQSLSRLGFDVTTGPEIETEYLNFDSVNIPETHPAREMQDTFFMGEGVVLRTHTSPVQMRTMRSQSFPLRILCPGAVYRADNDATHSPFFHQIEGLWVDHGIRMSDLKGTLLFFAKETFGSETEIRLRPSFFPFVEPGVEVDVTCPFCASGSGKGKGPCKVCKDTGWIEILGAGMVHPELFKHAGYDDPKISGFAFGIGIERISMLLNGIPDLRLFYRGDVRFLNQF
ncbi:MAG: phenylalanine--tRNA ligase subunit alpha [Bdellovibrionaceae bacterium]|nr:phenylalanine--tRNA ligase subunit alpha [Pseudobdellovibrionaceae bacterium]